MEKFAKFLCSILSFKKDNSKGDSNMFFKRRSKNVNEVEIQLPEKKVISDVKINNTQFEIMSIIIKIEFEDINGEKHIFKFLGYTIKDLIELITCILEKGDCHCSSLEYYYNFRISKESDIYEVEYNLKHDNFGMPIAPDENLIVKLRLNQLIELRDILIAKNKEIEESKIISFRNPYTLI